MFFFVRKYTNRNIWLGNVNSTLQKSDGTLCINRFMPVVLQFGMVSYNICCFCKGVIWSLSTNLFCYFLVLEENTRAVRFALQVRLFLFSTPALWHASNSHLHEKVIYINAALYVYRLLCSICLSNYQNALYLVQASVLIHTVYMPSILTEMSEQTVDQIQTPQNAASDQGLHCSPLIQQFRNINS